MKFATNLLSQLGLVKNDEQDEFAKRLELMKTPTQQRPRAKTVAQPKLFAFRSRRTA
jgi:hypothetical protein